MMEEEVAFSFGKVVDTILLPVVAGSDESFQETPEGAGSDIGTVGSNALVGVLIIKMITKGHLNVLRSFNDSWAQVLVTLDYQEIMLFTKGG